MTLTTVFLIWVIGFGGLSLFVKDKLALKLLKIKLPTILTYLLIATPLILVEEFLTCETSYFSCITFTYPAFLLMFLILFAFIKVFKLTLWPAVSVFGLMGWINEFILVGRIDDMSGAVLLIMSVLAFLIYFVLAIIPVAYLVQKRLSK